MLTSSAIGLAACLTLALGSKIPEDFLAEPTEDDVHFLLWTSLNHLDSPREVELTASSLAAAGFHPDNPTIILSHGFTSHGFDFGRPFAEAYLTVGKYNVFSIEWSVLAEWTDYFGAASRTRFVGEYSANLAGLLANNGGIDRVHLVGHSLGAHVVGFLGKKVQELGYGKVPRITGLDPAQPAFDLATAQQRLDKEDGEFVDIIHTNSGMIWEGCLSIPKKIGHMDFYPAGGKHQPGCTDICVGGTCTDDNINDLIRGGCSHGRAHEYFVESIYARSHFYGWICSDWEEFQSGACCPAHYEEMGDNVRRGAEGRYYMNVGEEEPFAMGENGC